MSKPTRTAEIPRSPFSNGLIRVVYELLFTVLLILASPSLVLKMLRRGQWKHGFGQRFGRFDPELTEGLAGQSTLWLNAVSVGEVNLTAQLVTLLQQRLTGTRFVVSTTTTTGMVELKRKLPDDVLKIYYPLDYRSFVRRTIRAIRPQAIVLVEADLWPNLIFEAQAEGIPVILVNALISEGSGRRYRQFGILFRHLFASFDRVFCADSVDKQRLVSLGCRPEAVKAVGHPKMDTAISTDDSPLDVRSILNQIGLPKEATVILGGSTHEDEELILARVYLQLKSEFTSLFLILVPRHFERTTKVARDLGALGITVLLKTKLPSSRLNLTESPHCLIVDTTGELRHFYREADIIVIGKSFVEGGGQNPIEPAALGRAIITGPNMNVFKAILPRFLEQNALIQVRDAEELEASVRKLLDDPEERESLGQRARSVVEENQGALERTADGIIARFNHERAQLQPKAMTGRLS